ncbi:MAG: copper resistance CopC family protein [Candidatus Rokuibacteriota bacterium]
MSRPALVVLALILSGAAGVEAHSFLDRADPRAGSTVKTAPAQVRIWFTESLEPAFSSVRVLDEAGRRVDKGDGHVDPSNLKLLRVSLPPLPPGTYKVIWRVLSVDSHVTEGDFTFRVAP